MSPSIPCMSVGTYASDKCCLGLGHPTCPSPKEGPVTCPHTPEVLQVLELGVFTTEAVARPHGNSTSLGAGPPTGHVGRRAAQPRF